VRSSRDARGRNNLQKSGRRLQFAEEVHAETDQNRPQGVDQQCVVVECRVRLHLHEVFDQNQKDDQASHEGKNIEQYVFAGMRRLDLVTLLGHVVPLFAI
jgi:hypothetical protein